MAYSFGRQFRRIAAEALTADREQMDALIARILPPREDGAPRVLQVKTADDCKRAPAAIVAAFFADAITGDEAADLLRKTEDPAFRKQPMAQPSGDDDPWANVWGDITAHCEEYRAQHPELVARWDREREERRRAAKEAAALVNNNENTSAACCNAAEMAPERPP